MSHKRVTLGTGFLFLSALLLFMAMACSGRHEQMQQQLALLYFPDSDTHVALNRLNSWIKRFTFIRNF